MVDSTADDSSPNMQASMERLHAYWRMPYILAPKDKSDANPFVKIHEMKDDRKAYILFRGKWNYIVMNRYPYNAGHLLVLPFREVAALELLRQEERHELMDLIVKAQQILQRALNPSGFNTGFNFGKAAGAGIPRHLHCHVVPRWEGDTNFMPVISNTRVLPDSMDAMWERLNACVEAADWTKNSNLNLLLVVPTETLSFPSSRLLNELYAADTHNLDEVERLLDVTLVSRDDWLRIEGSPESIDQTKSLFQFLKTARLQGLQIRTSDFHHVLKCVANGQSSELYEMYKEPLVIKLNRLSVIPKTLNQKKYLQCIDQNTVTFGIGPAGTGKTYLAMAMALKALLAGSVERILLTRPAVEAGEALGFLPGELQEKVLPYLTPLYDAMNDMMGKESTLQMVEQGTIEIAPLAYMRGRTLNNSFIILDEAQNTTHEQMMMFLTRLGDQSQMVVTGDITQVDLPTSKPSGLKEATRILKHIEGLRIFNFDKNDVVRHPLVQSIIDAYSSNN